MDSLNSLNSLNSQTDSMDSARYSAETRQKRVVRRQEHAIVKAEDDQEQRDYLQRCKQSIHKQCCRRATDGLLDFEQQIAAS